MASRAALASWLVAASLLALVHGSSAAEDQRQRPALAQQFTAFERTADGYADSPGAVDGDGCVAAVAMLSHDDPAVATGRVWWDGEAKRMATINGALSRKVLKNTTVVDRLDLDPAVSLDLEPFFNETVCYSKPLTGNCPGNFENHSCAPTFSAFTEYLPFADNYERYVNATFLDEDATSERWQWIAVQHTMLPNGTSPPGCKMGSPGCKDGPIAHVNITRNYTFTIGKVAVDADGRRPMLRYWWTQSMPFRTRAERDCFVFDYSLGYTSGPSAVPQSVFEPPGGIDTCVPIASASTET